VTENDLGGFQAVLLTDLGRRGVPEPVGAPLLHASRVTRAMDRSTIGVSRVACAGRRHQLLFDRPLEHLDQATDLRVDVPPAVPRGQQPFTDRFEPQWPEFCGGGVAVRPAEGAEYQLDVALGIGRPALT